MKYKITLRLIGYFSAVLLLFSILVGGLFGILFTRHTTQMHERDLKIRAVSIADTLSQFNRRQRHRKKIFRLTLRTQRHRLLHHLHAAALTGSVLHFGLEY